jgi:hypothetical protein
MKETSSSRLKAEGMSLNHSPKRKEVNQKRFLNPKSFDEGGEIYGFEQKHCKTDFFLRDLKFSDSLSHFNGGYASAGESSDPRGKPFGTGRPGKAGLAEIQLQRLPHHPGVRRLLCS